MTDVWRAGMCWLKKVEEQTDHRQYATDGHDSSNDTSFLLVMLVTLSLMYYLFGPPRVAIARSTVHY